MNEKVLRVVVAYKRSLVRSIKKRSPLARLKAKLYYQRNKAILKLKRRLKSKVNKTFSKTRKLFKRAIPSAHKARKPHVPKSFFKKPKKPSVKKFHVPKRTPRKR